MFTQVLLEFKTMFTLVLLEFKTMFTQVLHMRVENHVYSNTIKV